jgi:hypothetical protein
MADMPIIKGLVLFHPPKELEELLETLPTLSLLVLLESILLVLDDELRLVELLDWLDVDEELLREELLELSELRLSLLVELLEELKLELLESILLESLETL